MSYSGRPVYGSVCNKIIGHRSEYTSEVVPYTSSTIREDILPRMAGEYCAYYLVCSYLASLLSRSLWGLFPSCNFLINSL